MSLNGFWSVVLYYGLIVVLNKDQIGSIKPIKRKHAVLVNIDGGVIFLG